MEVADLAKVFPTETLEVGTVLFEQGDVYGDGFVVQQGRLESPATGVLPVRGLSAV